MKKPVNRLITLNRIMVSGKKLSIQVRYQIIFNITNEMYIYRKICIQTEIFEIVLFILQNKLNFIPQNQLKLLGIFEGINWGHESLSLTSIKNDYSNKFILTFKDIEETMTKKLIKENIPYQNTLIENRILGENLILKNLNERIIKPSKNDIRIGKKQRSPNLKHLEKENKELDIKIINSLVKQETYNKLLNILKEEKMLRKKLPSRKKKINLINIKTKVKSINDEINNYIRKKKSESIHVTEIKQMKQQKPYIINLWKDRGETSVYVLDRETCRGIINILMPKSKTTTKEDISRFMKELISLGSHYIQSFKDVKHNELYHLIHGAKTYLQIKTGGNNKDYIILQSSAYMHLGEYFAQGFMSLYASSLLHPSNLNKFLKEFESNPKQFKFLDYILFYVLHTNYKRSFGYNLEVEDDGLKSVIINYDIPENEAKINNLLLSNIYKFMPNKLLNLGALIVRTCFSQEFEIFDTNKFKFNKITYGCVVPLLYEGQQYPFNFMLNSDDNVIGRTYEGKYTKDEKKKDQTSTSMNSLDFNHVSVILSIYENRYMNNEAKFLFIEYFYNLKLDKTYLYNLVKEKHIKVDVKMLLDYILDLDTEYIPEIQYLIRIKHNEVLNKIRSLVDFYQEIKTKKYTLHNTIILLYIYTKFEYFINISIPKYTGREFTIFTPLDITIKGVRCLLNIYNNNLNMDFNMSPRFRLLQSGSYNNYMSVNKELLLEYVYSIVDNNRLIIEDKSINKLNKKNIIILINQYKIHIYKAVRYLIAKEAIDTNREFTVEKDACNSGLQILSLLFKSKSGAQLCGLLHPQFISEGQITDIYEYVRYLFNQDFNKISAYLEKFPEKDKGLFGKKVEYKDIEEYNLEWLYTSKGNETFHDKLSIYILFMAKSKTILDQRVVWKSLTMPQQYGVTNFSMKNTLINYLKDIGSPQNVRYFVSLIIRWYQYRVKPQLPLITEYLNVWKHSFNVIKGDIYMIKKTNKEIQKQNKRDEKLKLKMTELIPYKKIKPFTFTTNSFKWKFQVFKVTGIKVKVRKQQFKLYKKTDEHDIAQMFTSLPPIVIHGLDANIIHNIKEIFKENQYGISTIHDCFLVSSPYLFYLLINLENIYHDIYKSDYFTRLIQENNLDTVHLKLIRDEDDEDYLNFEVMCTGHYNFVR